MGPTIPIRPLIPGLPVEPGGPGGPSGPGDPSLPGTALAINFLHSLRKVFKYLNEKPSLRIECLGNRPIERDSQDIY